MSSQNLSAYDGGHPRVEVEYHNDSARITSKITTSILTGNDIWQRISVTETAPAGTTRVRLRIYHPKTEILISVDQCSKRKHRN